MDIVLKKVEEKDKWFFEISFYEECRAEILWRVEVENSFTYTDEILEKAKEFARERNLMSFFIEPENQFFPPIVFIDANIKITDNKEAILSDLHKLKEYGLISRDILPGQAFEEANNNKFLPQDLSFQLYTSRVPLNLQEIKNREDFIQKYQGNSLRKNIENDLYHIWEAIKYGATWFLSWDKRLLKRKIDGIKLETPERFVECFKYFCS